MTEDPEELAQREEDDWRVQHWANFCQRLSELVASECGGNWAKVVVQAGYAMADSSAYPIALECRAFAESEGWPDTLRAIARAMDEDSNRRRRDLERC